jgi:2-oxoglutarate dehydrogenase E1 component
MERSVQDEAESREANPAVTDADAHREQGATMQPLRTGMPLWDRFAGPNLGYVAELYERYRQNPGAVDDATRDFFARLGGPGLADLFALESADGQGLTAPARAPISSPDAMRIVRAARLARGIREYGHLGAHIDPLGKAPPSDPMLDPATHDLTDADLAALPGTIVWPEVGAAAGTCLDAIRRLRDIYQGPLGYEFGHIHDVAERDWLRDMVESGTLQASPSIEERRTLLRQLSEVEGFERFLQTTFPGQKRFSLEGTDMLVPMLQSLIHDAVAAGAREIAIGMAHRGRLNVLAHVLGKPYAAIFSEFHTAPNKDLVPSEGSMGINYGWSGDVKYHLGASATVARGEGVSDAVRVRLTLADNPSHLEFVGPVIEGFTRAAQDIRDAPGPPRQDTEVALAVTIHGDAAFPGEGVVAETLNLSRLRGYQTGGTIHIVVNNQLGFTTEPDEGRSTLYASDLAKGFEIPIIHANADDPEACLAAIRLAHAYRERFHKDFLVDLVGYRRRGHNEGDEPSFTQPAQYAAIADHPTVHALYAHRLAAEGVIQAHEAAALLQQVETRLRAEYDEVAVSHPSEEAPTLQTAPTLGDVATAVPAATLRSLDQALLAWPADFTVVPRLARLLGRRGEAIEKTSGIDWAHAEALAFASLLADGVPIRLSGQDSERGTFSQRHLALHDARTGARYIPLQHLPQARASFAVYNSPLSEAAVLGFEYGYSVHSPETLVLWEAQFGDFANAGQVLIDQFIAAARAKWRKHPSLVLLLPHGYEGQGPEHSSGRLERYLQLAAEDNLRVVVPSTAAQYFHLLRAQARLLGGSARPLVVMTPKSLLRHPGAGASLKALANGRFQPVLDDTTAADHRDRVERLILCAGKVAVDLEAAIAARTAPTERLAVVRVEQLYPFPADGVARVISGYPHLREVIWLQEEPRNMGAWTAIAPRLQAVLTAELALRYIGRPERASPAEGRAEDHAAAQAALVGEALAGMAGRQVKASRRRGARDE